MKGEFAHTLEVHKRGIKELNGINRKLFPTITLAAFFSAVKPYATVFFSAQILSELAGARRAEVLWKWVIAFVIVTGILAVLNAFFYQRKETLIDDTWGRKEKLYCEKMFSMDYADIDKQETHDLRAQIAQNENWASWGFGRIPYYYESCVTGVLGVISGCVLITGLFTSSVPEKAGSLTVLNSPLFLLLSAIVLIGVSALAGRLYTKSESYWMNMTETATFGNRVFSYFGFLSFQRERHTDIRMYEQQNIIHSYLNGENPFGADSEIGRLSRGSMGVYAGLGVCISTLITGYMYIFTCLKAWGGAFDVGSITQYVGAATALAGNIYALLEVYGGMKVNTEFTEKIFTFLDIPNAMYQGSLTTEKRSDRKYEVEFRNVSFKYPASENWALKNVSMKFRIGKRLAIVGENGSGKTTFIKLLCRLYDPQEGQILLNGIDIRKYNYRDYMGIFSVVFQDFQLISQPLGNNVAGSMTYDAEKVTKALNDAGFGDRLESMPEGLHTQLYKDFTENGVEISGGEAQKIAIARALYKDAPFIILDEPTAALDPIAEAEIYSKFNEIVTDKTAVFISHRLSSCRFCDEIAVFHEGKIVQQGTHEDLLLDESGKYYELWHAQAQYYSEEAARVLLTPDTGSVSS
ncbi:MAG: ABC transporter ATP-binding protein/permease [Lachnospiraceae bacterium]|nr:ABC transporter ATP-binding protein/permease [Lachnospiraceae bacterium]